MLELLRRLRRMRLLTMRGMFCLARAVWITGVTPLTLLKFAAGVSPRATALVATPPRPLQPPLHAAHRVRAID